MPRAMLIQMTFYSSRFKGEMISHLDSSISKYIKHCKARRHCKPNLGIKLDERFPKHRSYGLEEINGDSQATAHRLSNRARFFPWFTVLRNLINLDMCQSHSPIYMGSKRISLSFLN